MSKTIRDNAQQAALAILSEEVLYAKCYYLNEETPPTQSSKIYTVKVAGKALTKLIDALEEKRKRLLSEQENKTQSVELVQDTPVSIDNILKQASKSVYDGSDENQRDNRIIGVVRNSKPQSGYTHNLMVITSLHPYSAVADLTVPLSHLKYLVDVVDVNQEIDCIQREKQVIDTIAERLLQQTSQNLAINLLGQEGYNSVLQDLKVRQCHVRLNQWDTIEIDIVEDRINSKIIDVNFLKGGKDTHRVLGIKLVKGSAVSFETISIHPISN